MLDTEDVSALSFVYLFYVHFVHVNVPVDFVDLVSLSLM